MKFEIKQERLEYMLEKLSVGNMFPSSVISTKDGILFSIQREERGRAIRLLKLNESFFESIDKDANESLELDTDKFLKVVKKLPPGMILSCETKGNKLVIFGKFKDGRITNPKLTVKDPVGEVMTKLPFNMEKNVPIVKDPEGNEIKLECSVLLSIVDFKEISENASAIKTEFYKFIIDDKKFGIHVGDISATSDEWRFNPQSDVKEGDDLDVTFTYGIPEIAATFDKVVHIQTATNCPGWFYETTKEHLLGVFIPPFIQKDIE